MPDWNAEMKNLAGIGAQYEIPWPKETLNRLKVAIEQADKDQNDQDVKILTRAFQSLVKVRNHFLVGE